MPVKVTIIGGGSSSFVPLLIRRLMQSPVLSGAHVSLMDIDQGRLGVMQSLADKLIESEGSALRVSSTTDQRESLIDADFVVAAISVGGMDAWANDLEIPGRHGIVMHVADSVGPGGILRAFRNAPVLAEVARNCAEVAPDAWVFNYTNPAPVEAMAMRVAAPDVRSYALCSCTGHPSSPEWLAERVGVQSLEDLAATWTAPDAGPVTLADLPVGDEDWGIEVIDLIEAIVGNGNRTMVVNAPNEGAIPNLPDDAIVEVNAQINAYGIRPVATGRIPEQLAAHLRRYVDFQRQVVAAALSGDREEALHAFVLDPNTAANLDIDQTNALMDEMLEANAQHLRLFR